MSEPLWLLDINGISKHFGPERDDPRLQEHNLGLGVTREDDWKSLKRKLMLGYYNNSFDEDTAYIGAGLSKQFGDDYYAQLGGVIGALTGYDDKPIPLVAPTLTLGKKNLGRLNMMYAPKFEDKGNLIMMNLGIPLGR